MEIIWLHHLYIITTLHHCPPQLKWCDCISLYPLGADTLFLSASAQQPDVCWNDVTSSFCPLHWKWCDCTWLCPPGTAGQAEWLPAGSGCLSPVRDWWPPAWVCATAAVQAHPWHGREWKELQLPQGSRWPFSPIHGPVDAAGLPGSLEYSPGGRLQLCGVQLGEMTTNSRQTDYHVKHKVRWRSLLRTFWDFPEVRGPVWFTCWIRRLHKTSESMEQVLQTGIVFKKKKGTELNPYKTLGLLSLIPMMIQTTIFLCLACVWSVPCSTGQARPPRVQRGSRLCVHHTQHLQLLQLPAHSSLAAETASGIHLPQTATGHPHRSERAGGLRIGHIDCQAHG